MSDGTNDQRQPSRRLAAILAADIVGYSRLMEADETGTLDRQCTILAACVNPTIAAQGGRIAKTTGDGLLVEFTSAVSAVAAAAAIQECLRHHEAERPAQDRIRFRIGINLGEIVVDDGDVFGTDVNIAARLEALAPPGGICVSEKIHREVAEKIDLAFDDRGPQQLKNIARPIRIFLLADPAGEAEVAASTDKREQTRPAIAVLPFDNLNHDPNQDYFADGLAEDLITALAQWRSFPVIARNSSFTYKGRAIDVKQAARELGARYVVEGSVRRGGDKIRVTAQLIDGTTGHHLWAQRFDRDQQDVFAIQDELTQRIALTIQPELDRAEQRRTAATRTGDLVAWDHYLRGLAKLREHSAEANAAARDCFARAIELDPDYADGYAGLALAHTRDVLLECTADREASIAAALETARQAVRLDPSSASAHHVLGTVHIWRNEHELALAEARTAVALNPYDADGLQALGNKSDLAGDPAGIERMRQAQTLSPRDPDRHIHLTFLARALANRRDYSAAEQAAREALRLHPRYPHAYFILAIVLAHLDRVDEARAALAKSDELHPGFVATRAAWRPYTDAEANAHLLAGLRKAGTTAAES